MGRPSNYCVRKCEERLSIDLASLKRRGMLADSVPRILSWTWGRDPAGKIRIIAVERGVHLNYRLSKAGGEHQDIDELIPYTWTKTRFGGSRQWLQCPGCQKPCRVLYHGSTRFRCRRCVHLRYASQYEPPGLGGIEQADKIRKRLGDKHGSAFEQDEFPPRPRGMHWKTYRRLKRRYDRYQLQWTVAAMARFGITGF